MDDMTLDQARSEAGLSLTDLWIRYFALGGNCTPVELDAYLQGALAPPTFEHNLIVHAINEHHAEQGDDHPVPYSEDPA